MKTLSTILTVIICFAASLLLAQPGDPGGGGNPGGGPPGPPPNPDAPPVAPTALLVVSATNNSIAVSWTDNSINETGFEVERSLTSGSGFALIATVGVNVVSYSNTGLPEGTKYYYRVRAISTGIPSSGYTNEVNSTTLLNPPLSFTATAVSTTAINLAWIDNSASETGYQIESSLTSGSGFSTITTTAANATSYSVAGLASGTTYYFRVKSINATVSSIYSSEGSATTPLTAPTALSVITTTNSSIAVSWTDNSTNETGFEVERSLTSGSGFALIATLGVNNVSYSDAGLPEGSKYYYRVRAIAAGIPSSGYSNEANSTTLLNPPSSFTATAGSTTVINLVWIDNSASETGYQVESSITSGSGFSVITTTAANASSYAVTGLTAGTTYYFRIKAVNSTLSSNYSAEANATTLVPLAVPTSVVATAVSTTGINLTWNDNTSDETGFQIEQSLTSGSGFSIINTTAANSISYSVTSLSANTKYYFRIKAINANNSSPYSAEVNATTGLLTAPSALTATAVSTTSISLTWTDNSTNETGFTIERSLTSGTGFAVVVTTAANVVSYSNTGLTAGTKYYYRIKAVNGSGTSVYTTEATATAMLSTPTSLVASSASTTGINLTWLDNSANETGYQIEQSLTTATGFSVINTTTANAASYSVTGLTPGTKYFFRIKAVNATGTSAYSAEANAVAQLMAPTNLIATTVSTGSISLAWTDNSSNETGFSIERSLSSGSGFAVVATTTANAVAYTNTGLTAGILYYYRVKAVNSGGISAYTSEANATTLLTTPNALVATSVSTTGINLTWADNSTNETGYQIEQSLTTGTGFSVINTTGPNATSYSVTGLTPGTRYFFRLKAINATSASAYSAEANATAQLIAPTSLVATTVSASSINLTWTDNSSNETSFSIERSLSSGTGFAAVATPTANVVSYTNNSGLTGGTRYYYRIRALNGTGTSVYSPEVSAVTLMATPTSVVATAMSPSGINLTWTDNALNETSYQIERSLTTGTGFSPVVTTAPNANSYSDAGLSPGTKYFYRIKTIGAIAESAYSTEANATTQLVAPTSLVAITVSTTSVTLTWADNSSNETGFKIERSLTTGTGFALVTTTAANATTYTNTGLTANTTYFYRIRAANAVPVYSAYTPEVKATTAIPTVPTSLAATTTSPTTIDLTWTDTSFGESGFSIERSLTTGSGFAVIATAPANSGSYTNSGLTEGTKYYYRIRATSAAGNSAYTTEANATTTLMAPTSLAATAVSSSQIDLTWFDASSSESGFQIERSLTTGSGFSTIFTTASNATSYSNTGLTKGTQYFYRIKAVNGGNGSAYTLEATATTPVPPPAAPTALTAKTGNSSSVLLNWLDNSSDETGFVVERSLSPSTGYTTLATTGTDAVSFADGTAAASTQYYYRVRAVNAGGSSANTNTVSITTLNGTQVSMNQWVFQYKYDERQRMTHKKVPGADWVYMVYDNLDHLVMTQDGEQRKLNKWSFTKYDLLGRPIMTGIYTHDSPVAQEIMRGFLNGSYFSETYNGDVGNHGYTNSIWPLIGASTEVLTVAYYDNYAFVGAMWGSAYYYVNDNLAVTNATGAYAQQASNQNVKGSITGTKAKALDGSNNWLKTITYYDNKYRPIQTISDNIKQGTDRISSLYDFVGKVLASKTTHSILPATTYTVSRTFDYDHQGRLKKTWHSTNGAMSILLASNSYNELGQLEVKRLHNTDPATTNDNLRQFKQNVDYRYNIRGWLTSINDVVTPETTDLFSMNLSYNTGTGSQFNGNINEIRWRGADQRTSSYSYSYDPMNRLTRADYSNLTDVTRNGRFNEVIMHPNGTSSGYDFNGNIKFLQRNGKTGEALGVTTYGTMDNLTYTYQGNQLFKVSDSAIASEGFIEGANSDDDYDYDANGNMSLDKNKGITGIAAGTTGRSIISYNYLNLPDKVVKSTGDYIKYTYDATGRKLRQQVIDPNGVSQKTTEYAGEFMYENNALLFANHEEGRVVVTGTPEYQYHLKDHLGNIRTTFTTKVDQDLAKATLEQAALLAENSQFLNVQKVRRVASPIFDHTYDGNVAGRPAGGVFSERLSGTGTDGNTREKYGLAKSISVMPGDKIDMEVYGKYVEFDGQSQQAFVDFVTSVAQNTATGGVVIDGSSYSSNSASLFPYPGLLVRGNEPTSGPKAYMNWVVFDRDFKYIDSKSGYRRLTSAAKEDGSAFTTGNSEGNPHEKLSATLDITEAGYVYIYLSNEEAGPVEVYFDDFKVTQTKSPVIQTNDYYAFGSTFNSYSKENSVEQDFRFNGKELQNELGLNWLDYGARMYMSDLGRWGVIDPSNENYEAWTPYNYVANNPVRLIDHLGTDWFYYESQWNWHDATTITRPVEGLFDQDGNQYYQTLIGAKAVVVFNGSRSETLATDNTFTSAGAVAASVTVYGPDGKDDVHTYTGYTMTSNPDSYSPVDEGIYSIERRASAGSNANLPKNYYVKNFDNPSSDRLRTKDGQINIEYPSQLLPNGEGYKDEIFVHRNASNGFSGVYQNGSKISSGCLLINHSDYNGASGFDAVLSPVGNEVRFILILNRVGSDHNPVPRNKVQSTSH